jgi:hypothetical protein
MLFTRPRVPKEARLTPQYVPAKQDFMGTENIAFSALRVIRTLFTLPRVPKEARLTPQYVLARQDFMGTE